MKNLSGCTDDSETESDEESKAKQSESLFEPGADPGFQVKGDAFKKSCRAEEGAKMFGVFRMKNHDFTQKNHFFSNFRILPCEQTNINAPQSESYMPSYATYESLVEKTIAV